MIGLDELINPEEINLNSFKVKDELNPKVWLPNGKLRPIVRDKLLNIADDFKEYLDIPWVDVIDVTFTGSLANYNWSRFSDIDLHIIIRYEEVGDDSDELITNYLMAKKNLWNDQHDIKVFGFEVELYAQDASEPHTSTGVYSIDNDKWLVKPKKGKPDIDKEMVRKKAADIMNKIDDIEDLFKKGKEELVLDKIDIIWDKIKTMRKSGLDRGGEYSYENIVFKVLRRNGYMEKLMNIKTNSYDALKSI